MSPVFWSWAAKEKPKCPDCDAELVPHTSAGKGRYKDLPNLLICPRDWRAYSEPNGTTVPRPTIDPAPAGAILLVYVPSRRGGRHK